MGLIGSVKFMENRLGGRKPNHGKGRKPAQKNTGNDAVNEKNAQADTNQPSTEYDSRIGRKLDTTA